MEAPRIWPRYLGAIVAAVLTFAAIHLFAVYLCLATGWRITGWGTQCLAPACDPMPLWDFVAPMVIVVAAVVVGIPAYVIVRDNAPKWLRRWVR